MVMKTLIGSLLFILFFNILNAQETRYSGSLIKINFYDNCIDTTTAIGNWELISTKDYTSRQNFESVFTFNNTVYLIKNTSSESYGNFIPPLYSKTLINTVSKDEKQFCSGWLPECGMGIYLSPAVCIYNLESGIGLVINLQRTGYFFSNDTLYSLNPADAKHSIFHIAGKVENKFLVVVKNEENYKTEYYLEELKGIESLKFDRAVSFNNIQTPFDIAPLKTIQISDSLYFMNFQWNGYLYLMRFSNDSLTPIDSVELGNNFWTFRNNKLFYYDGQFLVSKNFNRTNLKFGESVNFTKVGLKFCFDYTDNYFAHIDSDTLKIFSLKSESLINKLYLPNISKFGSMLIDSPYVYIHKTDLVTDVKEKIDLPHRHELYQNYPNPFNPQTVISWKLSVSSFVNLSIYDILGREVAALVNEYQPVGIHNSTFDTQYMSLSNCIYFYTLRAGGFVETKKMIYLK